jgi:hypothetical protein
MFYDPHRDLYALLGVPAGALPGEIRTAIYRHHATARVQDLAEASRLLLSPAMRVRYDLQRAAHRGRAFVTACVAWAEQRSRRWFRSR